MKNEETKKNTTIVKSKSNPNKVNQHTKPDPRQENFLSYYLDPISETFSNALQSALKAGYSKKTSQSITSRMPVWLSESLGQMEMLQKAERNLNDILDLQELVPAMGAFGPILMDGKKIGTKKVAVKDDYGKIVKFKNGKTKFKSETKYEKIPIMVINPKLLNIKKDATFFIAERLGRMIYTKNDNVPRDPKDPIKPLNVFVAIQNKIGADREKYA